MRVQSQTKIERNDLTHEELLLLLKLWKCNVKKDSIKIDSLMDKIEKGYHKKSGGIVLDPDFQRDYKFTTKKESSIIESILLDIPIPTIYLSQDTLKDKVLFNVIDGKHRLKSIERFIKGTFRLNGLKILKSLDGKTFDKLPLFIKNRLLYDSQIDISSIDISSNEELEYEVFLRFNQETNPLTKQELLEVLYRSEYATWFKTELMNELENNSAFNRMFNNTGKRLTDKTLNYSVYACLAYAKFQLIQGKNDTPLFVGKYMKSMMGLEGSELENAKEETKLFLTKFINFYSTLADTQNIGKVFSKEFLTKKPQQGNHVFLISFLIPLTLIYQYIKEKGFIRKNMVKSDYEKIYLAIATGMKKINFGDFGGVSSTSYKIQYACFNEMKKCIDDIV